MTTLIMRSTNERLFSQVAAPQEAVMGAMLIKHLSRLCRQQAEPMSANIAQFRHKEYLERLVASMRGRGRTAHRIRLLLKNYGT